MEQQLAWFQHHYFGRLSERQPRQEVSPDQAWLFNEAESLLVSNPAVIESVTIPAYDRKKPRRKALPADLPRMEVLHDLPAEQK